MSELLGILAKLSKAATQIEIHASLVTTTELGDLAPVLVALEQIDAVGQELSQFVQKKQRETYHSQVNPQQLAEAAQRLRGKLSQRRITQLG